LDKEFTDILWILKIDTFGFPRFIHKMDAVPCNEQCICPGCLERQFSGNDQLAETYLKTRKLIEQREQKWIQQDQAREKRRIQKREETERLLLCIDLELKRRGSNKSSNKGEPTYSI
jgi:hypothetical protein